MTVPGAPQDLGKEFSATSKKPYVLSPAFAFRLSFGLSNGFFFFSLLPLSLLPLSPMSFSLVSNRPDRSAPWRQRP